MIDLTDDLGGPAHRAGDSAATGPGLDRRSRALRTRGRRRRRRRRAVLVVGVVVLLAVVAGSVAALVGRDPEAPVVKTVDTGPASTIAPVPSTSAAASAAGTWSALPAAPIPSRSGASSAWTGTEMLVWGGLAGERQDQLRDDGAAYDPATRSWSMLPPAPISARQGQSSVWTGTELIIWGGYDSDRHVAEDGAAYDPSTRTWRTLAPAPLSGRTTAAMVWTGREVIVLGGQPALSTDSARLYTDGSAYDPTTDTWRSLPAMPTTTDHDPSQLSAVWAGDRLLVWLDWDHVVHIDGSTIEGNAGVDSLSYEPSSDEWASRATPPSGLGIGSPIWTGSEVVLPATPGYRGSTSRGPAPSGLRGAVSDPTTDIYRLVAHGPVDDMYGPSIWTGRALARFGGGGTISGSPSGDIGPYDVAAWDPVADRWTSLPPSGAIVGTQVSVVWTGHELIAWGGLLTLDPHGVHEDGLALTPAS